MKRHMYSRKFPFLLQGQESINTPPRAYFSRPPHMHRRRLRKAFPFPSWGYMFASFAGACLLCDEKDHLLWINHEASHLFQYNINQSDLGIAYTQFLERYQWSDYHPRSPHLSGHTKQFQNRHPSPLKMAQFKLPSSQQKYVYSISFSVRNAAGKRIGFAHLLYDCTPMYENEVQTRQSYASLFTLMKTISQMKSLLVLPTNTATHTITSVGQTIGQTLTDTLIDLLNMEIGFLLVFAPYEPYISYAAMSGLTQAQRQLRIQHNGQYVLSDFLDHATIGHLFVHNVVHIDRAHMHVPFLDHIDYPVSHLYWFPLWIQTRIVGFLIVAGQRTLKQDEINMVQTLCVTLPIMIECVELVQANQDPRVYELALQEANSMMNTFIDAASHELRTPLTMIMGNLQLALRRFTILRRQMRTLLEQDSSTSPQTEIQHQVEKVQDPLTLALDGTRIQASLVEALEEDAHLRTHSLVLHMAEYHLLPLIEQVITQQTENPQRFIVEHDPLIQTRTVFIDRERITQVIHIYIRYVLKLSPSTAPIHIRVTTSIDTIYFAVHGEGAGISAEDQMHMWERFYIPKHLSVQNEQELSLGLGLSLCKELIYLHHGHVGLESNPDQGATFWFTLPLLPTQP